MSTCITFLDLIYVPNHMHDILWTALPFITTITVDPLKRPILKINNQYLIIIFKKPSGFLKIAPRGVNVLSIACFCMRNSIHRSCPRIQIFIMLACRPTLCSVQSMRRFNPLFLMFIFFFFLVEQEGDIKKSYSYDLPLRKQIIIGYWYSFALELFPPPRLWLMFFSLSCV